MSGRKISRDRLDLIMKLETIISSCSNDHMPPVRRNEETGEPRPSYGYPTTFTKTGRQAQNWSILTGGEIEESVIMGGVYKFGANRIPVFRNLHLLLEYLEAHYNLQIPE